MTTGFLLSL